MSCDKIIVMENKHALYVIYHEGNPAYTGYDGQHAYDSKGGANISIARMAKRAVQVARGWHSPPISSAELKALVDVEKKKYTIETYCKVEVSSDVAV